MPESCPDSKSCGYQGFDFTTVTRGISERWTPLPRPTQGKRIPTHSLSVLTAHFLLAARGQRCSQSGQQLDPLAFLVEI